MRGNMLDYLHNLNDKIKSLTPRDLTADKSTQPGENVSGTLILKPIVLV